VNRVALFANPSSGSGKSRQLAERARAEFAQLGIDGVIFVSDSADLVDEQVKLIAPEVDALIAVGGDGMAHLIAQVAVSKGLPLGIIPAGTGNDAARSWGLPLNEPEAVARLIATTQPREIDLGHIRLEDGSERWFLQILSTGFDAAVNERANRYRWPRGRMRYNVAIAMELPSFRPLTYAITVDGVSHQERAMLLAVANGPSYGGGMLVCPDASFTDGLFDLMILRPINKARFMAIFPKVYKGTHIRNRAVTIRRGESIRIEGSGAAYADGERVGELPLTATIAPLSLRVWTVNAAGTTGTA
jgi:diacylglycerol kinase (ATP)